MAEEKEEKEKLESKYKHLGHGEEVQEKPKASFEFQFQPVIVPITTTRKQGPSVWARARGETLNIVKKIEKVIPDYSYESTEVASVTDDKVCTYIVNMLSKTKIILFNATSFLYEVHREEKINKDLTRFRDSIDIFSDEIKVRFCKWKNISVPWMAKIIRYDWSLLEGAKKLHKEVDELKDSIFSIKTIRAGKKIVDYDPDQWNIFRNRIQRVEKELNELVRMFKEREAICNIKAMSLDKTFQKIRENIKDIV